MKMLLNKFRIQVRDVVVITDATQAPSAATEAWFDSMTCELVRKSGDAGTSYENGLCLEEGKYPTVHVIMIITL